MTNDALLRGPTGGLPQHPGRPGGAEPAAGEARRPGGAPLHRDGHRADRAPRRPGCGADHVHQERGPGERPRGTVVDRDQVRVTIEGIDLADNTEAFLDPDRTPRTAAVRQPATQAFLHTSKVGYEVNVIFLDAVAPCAEPAAR